MLVNDVIKPLNSWKHENRLLSGENRGRGRVKAPHSERWDELHRSFEVGEKMQRLRKMETRKIEGKSIQRLSCSLTCHFFTQRREVKLLRPLLASQEPAGSSSNSADCKHSSIKML